MNKTAPAFSFVATTGNYGQREYEVFHGTSYLGNLGQTPSGCFDRWAGFTATAGSYYVGSHTRARAADAMLAAWLRDQS